MISLKTKALRFLFIRERKSKMSKSRIWTAETLDARILSVVT